MKYNARILMIALVLGGWGLLTTGCDQVEEVLDDLSGADEEVSEEEEVDEEDEVAEAEDEDEEADEDEEEFDQGMYILAAFEAKCVDQEIDDADEAEEIKEEIYARYGFDQDTFEQAAEVFDGEDAVSIAIDASMGNCTEELAKGLGDAGADQIALDDPEEAGQFVAASFVTGCLEQELDDDDDVEEAKEAFLDHFGFTEDSFAEAGDEFEGQEVVADSVEEAMEQCDEDVARGLVASGPEILDDADVDAGAFGTAGFVEGVEKLAEAGRDKGKEVAEEEEEVAEPAPAPTPEPPMTGRLSASISGSDFENTTLELRVRHDFHVDGRLRGQREGRGFQVPFSGEVSEDGSIQARGRDGNDSIRVEGRLTESSARGTITGDVHQRDYQLRYNAN